MSSLVPVPIGIRTAFTGICCVNCMESPKSLVVCSRCKLAKYCNKQCQIADWKIHKPECSLLKEFQETHATLPGSNSFEKVANFKQMKFAQDLSLLINPIHAEKKWQRVVKFLNYSRVCSVCLKHAYESPTQEDWKCCSVCHFGWCCSKKHWDEYKDKHTSAICKKYVRAISIEKFLWNHIKKYHEQLLDLPPDPLPEAFERLPKNWDKYFRIRFPSYDFHLKGMLPPEYFPASTIHLSQAVSCLFAMYEFGIEKFQDKSSLCIHIVEPSVNYEVPPTCVWEEITHCLPNVKTLKTLFIGSEASAYIVPPINCVPPCEVESCASCIAQGRKRMFGLYGFKYYDFCSRYLQEESGDEAESLKPDLVVAFNPGIHQEDVAGWKRSLEFILDMNVPTLFTSFNLSEGDGDEAVLKEMNARMLYDFGPKKNPFCEMKPEIDVPWSEVDGFYHRNMYCMAFQGREE